jgi:hypothetical protein
MRFSRTCRSDAKLKTAAGVRRPPQEEEGTVASRTKALGASALPVRTSGKDQANGQRRPAPGGLDRSCPGQG